MNDSAQMVEDILDEVCTALTRGETVKLSSFGTFQVRQKSQRVGRNPKTGDEVPIAPRRVLVFRPSHVLKAMGMSDDRARSSLRFSFSRFNTVAEVERGVKLVAEAVAKIRAG